MIIIPIKKKQFDMIVSGEKKEELNEIVWWKIILQAQLGV